MLLAFWHEGYEVITSAWTVAAKKDGGIEIAYLWGADGVSVFFGATSVRRAGFNITLAEFMEYRKNGIFDLRGH